MPARFGFIAITRFGAAELRAGRHEQNATPPQRAAHGG
jgi:hypothetical protein